MYYPNTESTEKPNGIVYRILPNKKAQVLIRKNIRVESRAEEEKTYDMYVYDEVQFETNKSREYIVENADDLYNMHSGSTPTLEERLEALEKAMTEIGGML